MFKLLVFLCGGIFAVLSVLGREGGPLRDGLTGRYAPLVIASKEKVVPKPQVVAAAAGAVVKPGPLVTRKTPVAAVPAATAETGGTAPGEVLRAAFSGAADAPGDGLTLALPGVGAEAAAAPGLPTGELPAEGDAPVEMYIAGSSVNVRSGPSADTEALTRLPRGEAVLVLPSDTPGWSLIRIEADGTEGYVASRFLGGRPDDGLFNSVD